MRPPTTAHPVKHAVQAVRRRPGLACLVLAALIGAIALADHWNKTRSLDRAERAEWYCTHRQTLCGGPSSDRIEARWNERQLRYEVAVGVLAALGLGGTLVTARRGRAGRRPAS